MAEEGSDVGVSAVWQVFDTPANQAMDRLTAHAQKTSTAFDGVKVGLGKLNSALGTLTHIGFAAFGVQQIAHVAEQIIDIGSHAEQSRFRVAALFSQLQKAGTITGLGDFATSMEAAGEAGHRLVEMAKEGRGSVSDLKAGFSGLVLPIMRAGGGVEDVFKLTELLVPLSKAWGVGVEDTTSGVMRLLAGMANLRAVFVQNLGVDVARQIAAVAKGDPAQALGMLLSVMEQNRAAADAMGDTWENTFAAAKATLMDLVKTVLAPMLPVFKALTNLVRATFSLPPVQMFVKALGFAVEILGKVTAPLDWIGKAFGVLPKAISHAMGGAEHGGALAGITAMRRSADETARSMQQMGDAADMLGGDMGMVAGAGGAAAGALVATADAATRAAAKLDEMAAVGPYGGLEGTLKLLQTQQATAALQASGALGMGAAGVAGLQIPAGAQEAVEELRQGWIDAMGTMRAMGITAEEIPDTLGEGLRSNNALVRQYTEEWARAFHAVLTENMPAFQAYKLMLDALKKQAGDDAKPKPHVNDFRGSKIEVKVDARHQDPDRICASIVNALGRRAFSLGQSRLAPVAGL
jgi:hypothetical protein